MQLHIGPFLIRGRQGLWNPLDPWLKRFSKHVFGYVYLITDQLGLGFSFFQFNIVFNIIEFEKKKFNCFCFRLKKFPWRFP